MEIKTLILIVTILSYLISIYPTLKIVNYFNVTGFPKVILFILILLTFVQIIGFISAFGLKFYAFISGKEDEELEKQLLDEEEKEKKEN